MSHAMKNVARYLGMRRQKPFLGLGDSIHAIHTGTEWEAELRLSDLFAIEDAYDDMLAALKAVRADGRGETQSCGVVSNFTHQLVAAAIAKAEGKS